MNRRVDSPASDFRPFFDELYRPVVRFFRRWGFDGETAADLAQETFLRAFRGFDSYRGEASRKNWLFAIAANTLRNELRRRATLKRAAVELPSEEIGEERLESAAPPPARDAFHEPPLDRLLRRERTDALRAAVAELPPQMRRCVILRLERGLKLREIATVQRVSVETVKAHLFQARKRLRKTVADLFDEIEQREATSA